MTLGFEGMIIPMVVGTLVMEGFGVAIGRGRLCVTRILFEVLVVGKGENRLL